jgi:4a-hydroxytetrahydrobiopterin dehydratase
MKLSRDLLGDDDVRARLRGLPGWRLEGGHLHKRFVFVDFVQAFAFMTKSALSAERLQHHPNWSNVYKTVEVELWTHDVGGVTVYDFALAEAMERHAGGDLAA